MIPAFEIPVSNYQIKHFEKLSGKKHFTEFGTPVAIEYWESRPDFEKLSQPIIEFLRSRFLGQRIGLRMLGVQEHDGKTVEELLSIIQEIGHVFLDSGSTREAVLGLFNYLFKISKNEMDFL